MAYEIKWPIKFLARVVQTQSKVRIGVSLMSARDRLIAGQILIYKESRRGPGSKRRVGGVATYVV